MPFTEDNTTEQMLISALERNGWKYVAPSELGREPGDVIVEPMVRSALARLNPVIAADPSKADTILRDLNNLFHTTTAHNLVTQNEQFKKMVFETNSYPFDVDGRQISIEYFGTEINGLSNRNEYVVTNQWEYPKKSSEGGKRLDIVLLINGFPVAVGELKTPVRSAITWLDGAKDINDYEQSIPQMFVTNIFNFATEGKCFRYGSVCMPAAKWGPWHTEEDKTEGNLSSVKVSVEDMMTPYKVLDIFQFFTLYTTDNRYRKFKIIARYQQYQGANMIVERVRVGYPKQGLIWHFQGSGKSYLMEFAAVKLRMLPDLKNPTVIIVDDRLDLESQITAQFHSSSVANLETAATIEQLNTMLRQDIRKIIITTIFRFREAAPNMNPRDNIVILVDECHRTQEGDLGMKMRQALPNSFLFGLTGTPINRTDKNTFVAFGATEDRSGYMSKYSFSDSIRDHATLPLKFEPVPIDLHVDKETLDREFDEITEGLTDAEKAELSAKVNIKAIMYDEKRIHKVCAHMAEHFKKRILPNGYKAQVVVYDRPCCLMYKAELDKLLGAEHVTIVMDTNDDKADKYKEYSRSKEEEAALLDRFKDPTDPLQVVIVTSKLLTGFDAPVLQVMYLDKPMKDHTLLQAICRTNRTFDDGKTFGLIVDYIGIFDNVAKALNFDEAGMRKIITNIDEVKQQFPALLKKCLSYFMGVDRTNYGWEGLMAAQQCLPTDKEKDQFAADYQVLNRAWNALSPDTFLLRFQADYHWLTNVYQSLKPADGSGGLIWAALGTKTMEIVHSNISVGQIHDDLDALVLDANLIDEFIDKNNGAQGAAKRVEISLLARIQSHSDDPKYKAIGEKLERLREQHEQGLINSIEFLKMLLELAAEAVEAEKEVVPEEEVDKGKAALTELFNGVRNESTPVIVERLVSDIDNIVKAARFDKWQNYSTGRQKIKQELRKVIWVNYKIKDHEVFDKAYTYVEKYY